MREKCPITEFFLVPIFPHLEYLSLFSPNAGKYGPVKTPYLDTFRTVEDPSLWSWKLARTSTCHIFFGEMTPKHGLLVTQNPNNRLKFRVNIIHICTHYLKKTEYWVKYFLCQRQKILELLLFKVAVPHQTCRHWKPCKFLSRFHCGSKFKTHHRPITSCTTFLVQLLQFF